MLHNHKQFDPPPEPFRIDWKVLFIYLAALGVVAAAWLVVILMYMHPFDQF